MKAFIRGIKRFIKDESGMEPIYVAILAVMGATLTVAGIKYVGPIVYNAIKETGNQITSGQSQTYN